eukprot:jgi/Mesen1/8308/ME000455S07473
MGALKPGVLYALFLVFLIGFLIFSRTPKLEEGRVSRRGLRSKRIKLHKATADPNPKLDHIPFDPVVAQYEQDQDDRMWEKEKFKQHAMSRESISKQRDYYAKHIAEHRQARHHEEQKANMHDDDHHSNLHEAEIEHHENHEVEDHHDGEFDPEDYDREDYFDTDHFNITSRLATLFPLIDVKPVDDRVSVDELTSWHLQQVRKQSLHRTDRELDVIDRNHDGFVTLKEYLHDDSEGDAVKEDWPDYDRIWVQHSKEQFPLADLDGDGKLSREEFNDFLHPEDSENAKLHQWSRMDEIKNRDTDKDGRLKWEEFHEGMFGELRDAAGAHGDDDDDDDDDHHAVDSLVDAHRAADPHAAREKFRAATEKKVARSKANFLTEEELEPVMSTLSPGERHYAREQANHMMEQADTNHDKLLSLDEMVDHPYVFYNTAHDAADDDDGGEDYPHEEFRRRRHRRR